jgi:hypothetical protein
MRRLQDDHQKRHWPDPLLPVHRHDVPPDPRRLEHLRCRNEAEAIEGISRLWLALLAHCDTPIRIAETAPRRRTEQRA